MNLGKNRHLTAGASRRLPSLAYLWCTGAAALALAFWCPLMAAPWPSFYKDLIATAALGFWLLAVRPRRLHGPTFFLLGLCVVVAGQYAAGLIDFHDDAFLATAYLLLLALAFEVGAAIGNHHDGGASDRVAGLDLMAVFWWAIITVALGSAVIAFRQWLGVAASDFEIHVFKSRPYANLGQPNHLGTLLLLGACAALYLQQRARRRALAGWTALPAALFLLAGTALTLSRTAWLFIGVAFAYLHWRMKRGELRLPMWLPTALVVFFVACVLVAEPAAHWLGLSSLSLAHRATQGGRLQIWSGMLSAVWHEPWYGYGWLQTVKAQWASPESIYHGWLAFSHNLCLDLLLWMGPWLGLLVIVTAAWWLWRHFSRASGTEEAIGWLAFAALLNHSLLEYPYAYLYFVLVAGLLLGWLTGRRTRFGADLGARGGLVLSCGCAAVLAAGIYILVPEYNLLAQSRVNDHLRRARIANLPKVDLDKVKVLDSLRAEERVLAEPRDKARSDAATALLKRVTQRMPTKGNLARLVFNYAYRAEPSKECAALNDVRKFYGRRVAEKVSSDVSKILTPNCVRE
jgi:O-antigen ligase